MFCCFSLFAWSALTDTDLDAASEVRRIVRMTRPSQCDTDDRRDNRTGPNITSEGEAGGSIKYQSYVYSQLCVYTCVLHTNRRVFVMSCLCPTVLSCSGEVEWSAP